MPKYMDTVAVEKYPVIWVVNPEGRVVPVEGKIEKVQIKEAGGTRTAYEFLGKCGAVLEKAHNNSSGWRLATKDEAKDAEKVEKDNAAADKKRMEEAQKKREAAMAHTEAAKVARKEAEGTKSYQTAPREKEKGE